MNQQKSDFKRHISIFINIAALVSGAALLFCSCENNIEKIKAFNTVDNLPVVEATNFETLYTDSGEVRFYLKTPKLLRFEAEGKPYIEFPEGIELIKYDNNQNIISGITANYAKQFVEDKKWEAKNNVIATNIKGDTLKTEHLIWDEKTERIYTEEYVKIIRANQIITGIGFQSDQSLENWRIKNPKGTIYVDIETNRNNDTISSEPLQKSDGNLSPFREPIELTH
ncbi:MAG: LPS export ABC transporter periplasmic protein LptC [Prolixibacteraceae bacterium]|nr:LPS export ABC transporter periplasmic protein LptC [Prolixibacteraceae bacterium]